MSDPDSRSPRRDAEESVFSTILARLDLGDSSFLAAVFFDDLGETIDYHSYLDPFDTRLVAAHHGLFMSSANGRCRWMGLGDVSDIEMLASERESHTLLVGEDLFLTVLVEQGGLTDVLRTNFDSVIESLRQEVGI